MENSPVKARQVAIWTATIVIVLLSFVFLWLIRNVLFLVFLSILLATGIEPLVNWLRRGPFNRSGGILFVYTVIFGLIALLFYLTIPPLIDEGQNLVAGFTNPATAKAAIANIGNNFIKGIATTAYDSVASLFGNFKVDASTVSVGLGLFEGIFSALTVFVIAFYWLTERPIIKRFVFSFIKLENRERGRILWNSVEGKLGAWLRGQLVLMLFIGVVAAIGYTIMGLKFAFALAVFAGLAELIPLVGPYIGGAPAVLIALTQSVTLALVVIGYIVVIQLIEGNFLVPRIMESAVGVTPLTVIVGILVGSTLAGIQGALLAVPIAAAIQVVINNVLSFGSSTTPVLQALDSANDTGRALQTAAVAKEKEVRSQ